MMSASKDNYHFIKIHKLLISTSYFSRYDEKIDKKVVIETHNEWMTVIREVRKKCKPFQFRSENAQYSESITNAHFCHVIKKPRVSRKGSL